MLKVGYAGIMQDTHKLFHLTTTHLLHHLPISSIHISTLCSRMEIMHFLYGDLKKKKQQQQLYKFIYIYVK